MKVFRATVLILLFLMAGFLLGGLFASFTIEQPAGLAGGAIAVSYGLTGAFIGLIGAIFIVIKARIRIIVLFIGIAIIIIFLSIFALIRNKRAREANRQKPIVSLISFQREAKIGIGMAKPKFYEKEVIYFYHPNLEKGENEHSPIDSLVFKKTELGHELAYAPPWLYPAHFKLDYDILYFKVISMTKDWVQLEVNQQTQYTQWVSVHDIEIIDWTKFLLSVHSVQFDSERNSLKVKPLDNASVMNHNGVYFTPVEVKGDWLRVNILNGEFKKVTSGWLRWRQNEHLLISYSLLS